MDKLGAKYESSLLRADAFVVPDVTDPAEETLWHAFLSGGLLLSPQAFSHGEGPAVKYCCAVSIRRTVYISSGFQEENPHLCAAITGRMQQLCNMWKLLKDMPLFLQCLQKAQLRHRPSAELVAFVTQKESKQILSVLGVTGQPTTGLCCKFLTRTNAAVFYVKLNLLSMVYVVADSSIYNSNQFITLQFRKFSVKSPHNFFINLVRIIQD